MKAMILAAGRGERMRPLTLTKPKPLLEVQGKPLIVHTIERLKKAGFDDLVINVSYLAEQIEALLGDGMQFGVQISYSREAEPLETGGGIAKALPLLCGDDIADQQPFVVINSDVWTDMDLSHLTSALKGDDLAHLVLVDNPQHNLSGDFCLVDGKVVTTDENKASLTYSGVGVLHPQLILRYGLDQPAYRLLPVLMQAIDSQQVSGEHYLGEWLDVGTPERFEQLQNNGSV